MLALGPTAGQMWKLHVLIYNNFNRNRVILFIIICKTFTLKQVGNMQIYKIITSTNRGILVLTNAAFRQMVNYSARNLSGNFHIWKIIYKYNSLVTQQLRKTTKLKCVPWMLMHYKRHVHARTSFICLYWYCEKV